MTNHQTENWSNSGESILTSQLSMNAQIASDLSAIAESYLIACLPAGQRQYVAKKTIWGEGQIWRESAGIPKSPAS